MTVSLALVRLAFPVLLSLALVFLVLAVVRPLRRFVGPYGLVLFVAMALITAGVLIGSPSTAVRLAGVSSLTALAAVLAVLHLRRRR